MNLGELHSLLLLQKETDSFHMGLHCTDIHLGTFRACYWSVLRQQNTFIYDYVIMYSYLCMLSGISFKLHRKYRRHIHCLWILMQDTRVSWWGQEPVQILSSWRRVQKTGEESQQIKLGELVNKVGDQWAHGREEAK